MPQFLDRLLDPSVVWVLIPLTAIVFWGVNATIRSLRGVPKASDDWKAEVDDLRARVDELERRQRTYSNSDDRIASRRN
jgi:CHASE3 domain sensor protein